MLTYYFPFLPLRQFGCGPLRYCFLSAVPSLKPSYTPSDMPSIVPSASSSSPLTWSGYGWVLNQEWGGLWGRAIAMNDYRFGGGIGTLQQQQQW